MVLAKLFNNGRSQAVRIPAEFRFQCEAVYMRRNPKTGDLILSARPNDWDAFRVVKIDECDRDFLDDRNQGNFPSREVL